MRKKKKEDKSKYFQKVEEGDKLIVILEDADSCEMERVVDILKRWEETNIIIANDSVGFIIVPKDANVEVLSL